MKKEYDIFISYRREGGKEYARNLTSELVSRGFHPFLDFDELKDGKFDKRITDAIESAPVFMFILSPGSLDRCVNEDDWVRKEILHAVEHKRHIVPVDIDKQFEAFPTDKNFPQEIREALGQHQFSQIQTEMLYKVSIDEMVRNRIQPAIEEYTREKQKAAGTTGAEIHIETDMDCHVQRFHRDIIIARVEEENVIHLPKGKHKLQFIAVGNPEVKETCEYKVQDITESDFIEVFLQEKAGIVAVNNDKIALLEQERDSLAAKIEALTRQLDKAASDHERLAHHSASTIQRLNQEKQHLQQQCTAAFKDVELKTKEIALLQQRLAETLQDLDAANTAIIAYKDQQERERQAKLEAKRKEAEQKAKEERERKAREEEIRRKAEEIKKRGITKVGKVEFRMIRVEGGTFTMGATPEMENCFSNEMPSHEVTLSNFSIGETLVSQALWKEIMGSNPSYFKGDNNPVECVSWNDCQEFIKKLNEKTGKHFRLPTEAEWEFAARGGNKSKHTQYSGSGQLDEVAWYGPNSNNKTHSLKTKKTSELGLYDMSGNVWEWCQDRIGGYCSTPQTDPTGPASGPFRVYRGGGWADDAWSCRSSYRGGSTPDDARSDLGFRLALSE